MQASDFMPMIVLQTKGKEKGKESTSVEVQLASVTKENDELRNEIARLRALLAKYTTSGAKE